MGTQALQPASALLSGMAATATVRQSAGSGLLWVIHASGTSSVSTFTSIAQSLSLHKPRRQMSPPQRYSYVNARPQTKAEKRQTRTAIRSHIGRWTQEKQQKLEASPIDASERSSPPESSRTVS